MSSNDTFIIDLLDKCLLGLYRYANPIVYLLGVLGNLFNLWILSSKSWKKNVCACYFCIYSIVSLIYFNCIQLETTLFVGWNINLINSNNILCKFYYYILFNCSFLLPTILLLASIDRLLISSRNIDTRLYSSKRLFYLSTTLAILFWLIFNSHTFIQVAIQQISSSYAFCSYIQSKVYMNFLIYSSLIIALINYLSMMILTILSFKNLRHHHIISHQHIRRMTKKDFQLLRCLFLQDIFYICLSTIVFINFIYMTITRDKIRTQYQSAIINLVEKCINWTFDWLYISNFFILISTSKHFRNEFKRLFHLSIHTRPNSLVNRS